MPQGVARRAEAISTAAAIPLAMSLGMVTIAAPRLMQLAQNNPMNWAYMIWLVMLTNGAKTGMTAIVALLRPILQVQLVGRTVCAVVAIGSFQPGSVVLRAVTQALLATVSTIRGFA